MGKKDEAELSGTRGKRRFWEYVPAEMPESHGTLQHGRTE